MADEFSNSLVDIGKLSKPADTLVKKISKGVGGVFEPWQLRRVAKAEAEAAIIKANADIEISLLQRRAVHRFIEEEAKHQENMEAITSRAIPLLSDGADPSSINDDWITNFFSKARLISDERMQELWAKILSGEANTPGTFSRRTVNAIADLDERDIAYFSRLAPFVWTVDDKLIPLIFDMDDSIYESNNLDSDALIYLDNIGLIRHSSPENFTLLELGQNPIAKYFDREMSITRIDKRGFLSVGQVIFTPVGEELTTLCSTEKINGLYEYVEKKLAKESK